MSGFIGLYRQEDGGEGEEAAVEFSRESDGFLGWVVGGHDVGCSRLVFRREWAGIGCVHVQEKEWDGEQAVVGGERGEERDAGEE